MKLSISISDVQALEIQKVAEELDRPLSWVLQKAWEWSRVYFKGSAASMGKIREKSSGKQGNLKDLRGCLKSAYPRMTSVKLAKTAFMDID